MGEMADMALDDIVLFESLVDDYVYGDMSMHEAFEHGILNADGTEMPHVQAAYDRNPIMTYEDTQEALVHAERDLMLGSLQAARVPPSSAPTRRYLDHPMADILNDEAIDNLYKETPTCNCCRTAMLPRIGKFGKFYYCPKRCPDQKTVSDAYWQSVRR